jgi:hypothetical protein
MYSLQLAEPSRSEQSPRSSDSPFLQRNKIPLPRLGRSNTFTNRTGKKKKKEMEYRLSLVFKNFSLYWHRVSPWQEHHTSNIWCQCNHPRNYPAEQSKTCCIIKFSSTYCFHIRDHVSMKTLTLALARTYTHVCYTHTCEMLPFFM